MLADTFFNPNFQLSIVLRYSLSWHIWIFKGILAVWQTMRDPWGILPSIFGIIMSITLIYILKRVIFPQISTPIHPVLYALTSTRVLFNSPNSAYWPKYYNMWTTENNWRSISRSKKISTWNSTYNKKKMFCPLMRKVHTV